MLFKKSIYHSLGLKSSQISEYKKLKFKTLKILRFKNATIKISNPYWFLQSAKEIFIDEVYKFKSGTDSPTIIDCGANWGLSIMYYKSIYPNAHIIAFEPDKEIFELLSNNIGAMNFQNVILHNEAVWTNNELIQFASEGGVGGTLSHLTDYPLPRITVKGYRLMDLLQQKEKIDFLKLDIEGAEYDVIMDCKYSLEHIDNIFIEYHGYYNKPQKLHEILKVLCDAGFRYYLKEAWNIMTHPFDYNVRKDYDLQTNIFCYKP